MKDKYNAGLKEVIARLRSRNVKVEFEMVANELTQYRRRFCEQLETLAALPS